MASGCRPPFDGWHSGRRARGCESRRLGAPKHEQVHPHSLVEGAAQGHAVGVAQVQTVAPGVIARKPGWRQRLEDQADAKVLVAQHRQDLGNVQRRGPQGLERVLGRGGDGGRRFQKSDQAQAPALQPVAVSGTRQANDDGPQCVLCAEDRAQRSEQMVEGRVARPHRERRQRILQIEDLLRRLGHRPLEGQLQRACSASTASSRIKVLRWRIEAGRSANRRRPASWLFRSCRAGRTVAF